MNERIKELAEQAVQLVADEHTKGDVSRLNTDAYHVKDLINVKFAELIVRECANYALEKGKASPDTDFRTGSLIISEFLLAHFGVEE